jgi:hypothetical protein
MDILDNIEKVLKFIKPLSLYKRSFHFAYWIVPVVVGFCWYTALEHQDLKNDIAVIPLISSIDQNKQILSQKGFLIVTNELNEPFKIPLKGIGRAPEIWTSLKDSLLKLNDDRVFITKSNILQLNMPLYGDNHIFGMVVKGESNGELLMPGKSIAIKDLLPVANISIALVLSVFCAVAFGFGLIVREFPKSY